MNFEEPHVNGLSDDDLLKEVEKRDLNKIVIEGAAEEELSGPCVPEESNLCLVLGLSN